MGFDGGPSQGDDTRLTDHRRVSPNAGSVSVPNSTFGRLSAHLASHAVRSVRVRLAAVSAYAAELMRDESQDFNHLAPSVGVYPFPSLSRTRDGVPLSVWGVRFDSKRVEVIVSAERHGPIYRVVRDGFVAWDDGRRTTPDQQWYEYTD